MSASKRKRTMHVSQFILDGCFRSFQSGMSPIDVVVEVGIKPAIVRHCYELFLDDPYAYGDGPGEHGRPIMAPLRFAAGISAWARTHAICGDVRLWFRAAMEIIVADPELEGRAIVRAREIKRDPEPFAQRYGLRGDVLLLAAFEIVYTDDALHARCLELACFERVSKPSPS